MDNNSYNRKIRDEVQAINNKYIRDAESQGNLVKDMNITKNTLEGVGRGGSYLGRPVGGMATGGMATGGKKRGRPSKKNMAGGDWFDDAIGIATKVAPLVFGIGSKKGGVSTGGMETGGRRVGRPCKKKSGGMETGGRRVGRPCKKSGSGVLSSLLGAVGLGKEGEKMATGGMETGGCRRGRPCKKNIDGSGMLSSLLGAVGLGKEGGVSTGGKKKRGGLSTGGMATGGAKSKWINHVKAYAKKHNVSYKEAMQKAKASYKK